MEENHLNEQFKYSHEDFLHTMLFFLRTPAITTDGYSRILVESSDGSLNPEQTSFLEIIRRSSRDSLLLLDLFSYVLEFDRGWRNKIYGEESETENLSRVVSEALADRTSFGVLRLDPNIDITKEIPDHLPLVQANTALLVTIIRLMIMAAVHASPSCSKILIKAEADEWIDFYVVSNLGEIRYRFDDLQPKYSFSNIYDAIHLEFRDAQKKKGAREFYPVLLAVVHGLSTIHNAEFRVGLSEADANLVIRLPIKAG